MPENITTAGTVSRIAASSFETDFQAMFDENAGGNDDGWTKVANAIPPQGLREEISRNMSFKALPALDTLPRPERLFDTLQPSHLIVKVLHNGMVVQSSHQPSIELLAGYLRKYTKLLKNVSAKVSSTAYCFYSEL